MGRGRVWDWLREGAGTGAGKVKEEKGVLWLFVCLFHFFICLFFSSLHFFPILSFYSSHEKLFPQKNLESIWWFCAKVLSPL